MSDDTSPPPLDEPDPLFLHARRESVVLFVAFGVCLLWSVGTSYWLGYDVSPQELKRTVWGMPHWVFWGIAVPWFAADVFTVIFCLFCMKDDPLGDVQEQETR